jgi:hypothetical protein
MPGEVVAYAVPTAVVQAMPLSMSPGGVVAHSYPTDGDCPKDQCHHPMLCWKQYSVVNPTVSVGFLLPSPFLQQKVLPSQQEVPVPVLEPTHPQNSTQCLRRLLHMQYQQPSSQATTSLKLLDCKSCRSSLGANSIGRWMQERHLLPPVD